MSLQPSLLTSTSSFERLVDEKEMMVLIGRTESHREL